MIAIEDFRKKHLTEKQNLIIDDIKEKSPRHVIFEGAIRSGKTWLGIYYWISILSRLKNCLCIMTGQTISSLKRNILNDLNKLFGVDTNLNQNNEFEMCGNRVVCFGSDKSDSYKSMRGSTAAAWYANEIALSHQNTVLEAFGRCSEKGAKIIWDTNPDKPTHYIKTNYIDKSGQKLQDGTYNILSYHFSLDDNTFLDKNYVESLKVNIPRGAVYDRLILGQWKATERAIYQNYKVVGDNVSMSDVETIIYGLDFGYNHPTAMVEIMFVKDQVYIKGCLYKSHLVTSEIVDEVKKIVKNPSNPIYCDTAEPDKIRALKDAGLNAIEAKKDVVAGINYVKGLNINLINTDSNLIREFENYEYRQLQSGEVTEEPVKFADDYVDAVRYALYTHSGFDLKTTKGMVEVYVDKLEFKY